MDKYFADISRNMFLVSLILLAVLSLAASAVYVLMPEYLNYVTSKDSHRLLSATVNDGRNYELEMEQARAAIASAEQQMSGEDINLPFQQFESYVISELQSVAWQNSIELGGVRPRQGQIIDHYREVLFDVDLAGQYFDLYRFLLDLQQAAGFLVVSEFSISPVLSTNLEPQLAVRMSLSSYRQERP